jgi:uncharacterized protein (DUF433 family)
MFMSEPARFYTPAEAGVISGLGRKAIDNAIDKRVVPMLGPGKAGGAVKPAQTKTWRRRLISQPELVWIYVYHEASGAFPKDEWEGLFKRYLDNVEAPQLRLSNLVIIDLACARGRITQRAGRLERAKRNVVCDPEVLDGEPVYRGTRVPIYDIAASVRKGISKERIRAAYSVLGDDAIEEALLYAEAYPPRGRPRTPARTSPALVPMAERLVRRKPGG